MTPADDIAMCYSRHRVAGWFKDNPLRLACLASAPCQPQWALPGLIR
jgi:hypothetical protein